MNDHDIEDLIASANPIVINRSSPSPLSPAETDLCEAIMSTPLAIPTQDSGDFVASYPTPDRHRQRSGARHPRRRVVAAGAAAAVLLCGTAAAAGLLPGRVEERLGLAAHDNPDNPGFEPDYANAEAMVSVTEAGATFEVWRAPTEGGGYCEYERLVTPDGAEDGGVGCSAEPGTWGAPPPEGYVAVAAMDIPAQITATTPTAIYGQAPVGAHRAEVVLSDGTVLDVTVDEEGWFITAVAFAVESDYVDDPVALVSARFFADDSSMVGEIDLTTNP